MARAYVRLRFRELVLYDDLLEVIPQVQDFQLAPVIILLLVSDANYVVIGECRIDFRMKTPSGNPLWR